MVSHTAIGESALFLQALGNWITQEYQDLVGRGSEEVQAWQLISHCVRAIFWSFTKLDYLVGVHNIKLKGF